MAVTTVFAIVILIVAIRLGGGREREFMHAVLAPEVTNATITKTELTALAGHRRSRRVALRTRTEGLTRRQEKHILKAIGDLADDLCASGGTDSPDVEHSRTEIARLRSH